MRRNEIDEAIARECRIYHAAFCIVTGADPEDPKAVLAPTTPEQDRAIDAEIHRMMAAPHGEEEHVSTLYLTSVKQDHANEEKLRRMDEAFR